MTRLIHFLTPTGAMRAWWAVLVTIVALGAAVGFSVAYTARSQSQSDQRWCDLLDTIGTPLPTPTVTTPTTERAVRVNKQIQQLRRDFHCD